MTEPSGPSQSSAERLAIVLRYYRQAMSDALSEGGFRPIIPTATWLLLAIAREPGTVGELALRLGTTKQAVSRLTERLVDLGYCDRRRGTANRRQVMLSATDEGAAAAAAMHAGIEEADAILLAGLDERERDAFRRALARVAGASTAAPRLSEAASEPD